MEDTLKSVESLFEKAADYGKTSLELAKLKALDKTSDVVSSIVSRSVVAGIIIICIIFLSMGIALWLGELLGTVFYGFIIVAAFYGLTGVFIHFFMYERLSSIFRNFIIKQALK